MSDFPKLLEAQHLIDVYYSLIGMDHHKTRDTYFTIRTVLQPNTGIVFIANHAGYHNEIGDYGDAPERINYGAAADDLVSELKRFITKELDFANRVLSEPADWGAEDARQATKKIEILTNAGLDWLQLKGN